MTLDGIPSGAGHDREDWIYNAVLNGRGDATFGTITSTFNSKTATFRVFEDALKIDGVRVNVSAATQQKIADITNCMLLTPRLADLIWLQRQVTLPPCPRGNIVGMDSTQAMLDHSAKVDAELAKQGNPAGLKCTVGKHWVIDNDILAHPLLGTVTAENYGWHFEGTLKGIPAESAVTNGPNGHPLQVIQGRGWRHNFGHVDYSQICVLVSKSCLVDGLAMELPQLLQDPSLAPLASHQGVVNVLRQPGVAEVTGKFVLLGV